MKLDPEQDAASTLKMVGQPKWRTLIDSAIHKFENQTVLQIATLNTKGSKAHVRSHVFREFIASTKHHNLQLLISSTDIRTPKVAQILANPNIELVWWIDGTKQQFRISGRASIVPAPAHDAISTFGSSLDDPEMQALEAVNKEGIDWETKRVEVFKAMSPVMKASWCRPAPGIKLEGGHEEAKKWPTRLDEPGKDSSTEERRNWETAMDNFALVLIEPTYVDFVDLGIIPNRRFSYARDHNGQWDEEELVP